MELTTVLAAWALIATVVAVTFAIGFIQRWKRDASPRPSSTTPPPPALAALDETGLEAYRINVVVEPSDSSSSSSSLSPSLEHAKSLREGKEDDMEEEEEAGQPAEASSEAQWADYNTVLYGHSWAEFHPSVRSSLSLLHASVMVLTVMACAHHLAHPRFADISTPPPSRPPSPPMPFRRPLKTATTITTATTTHPRALDATNTLRPKPSLPSLQGRSRWMDPPLLMVVPTPTSPNTTESLRHVQSMSSLGMHRSVSPALTGSSLGSPLGDNSPVSPLPALMYTGDAWGAAGDARKANRRSVQRFPGVNPGGVVGRGYAPAS
ncbi:hypothetical protein HDU97_010031 [Phlyctochytrium planicorne]|nr:hypothetical protein HDU97_010031 [Phlyctochytrium planicorne]